MDFHPSIKNLYSNLCYFVQLLLNLWKLGAVYKDGCKGSNASGQHYLLLYLIRVKFGSAHGLFWLFK